MTRKRIIKIGLTFYICIFLIGVVGCVSQATRGLNYQNFDAARKMEAKITDPELKQMATDIASNSSEIAKDIGDPAQKVAYSPQASAEIRKQAQENRELREKLKKLAMGPLEAYAPWALSLVLGAGGIYTKVRQVIESTKTTTLITGGAKFAKSIPSVVNKLKSMNLKDPKEIQNAVALLSGKFKEAHKTVASAAGVAKRLSDDIHKLRKKGVIDKIDSRTIEEREADPNEVAHQPTTTPT